MNNVIQLNAYTPHNKTSYYLVKDLDPDLNDGGVWLTANEILAENATRMQAGHGVLMPVRSVYA